MIHFPGGKIRVNNKHHSIRLPNAPQKLNTTRVTKATFTSTGKDGAPSPPDAEDVAVELAAIPDSARVTCVDSKVIHAKNGMHKLVQTPTIVFLFSSPMGQILKAA